MFIFPEVRFLTSPPSTKSPLRKHRPVKGSGFSGFIVNFDWKPYIHKRSKEWKNYTTEPMKGGTTSIYPFKSFVY